MVLGGVRFSAAAAAEDYYSERGDGCVDLQVVFARGSGQQRNEEAE